MIKKSRLGGLDMLNEKMMTGSKVV